MPVGVGVGVSLGSATIYLFADASGMRSGLAQAEKDAINFQKRLSARAAQQGKTTDATRSASDFKKIADQFGSAKIIDLQKRVRDSFVNTSNDIDVSFKKRNAAVKGHAKVVADANRLLIAGDKAVIAAKKRLEQVQANLKAARIKSEADPTLSNRGRTGGFARAEQVATERLARAKKQLKDDTVAANKAIASSSKRTQDVIETANKRQERSIQELRNANNTLIQSYRAIAKQAGPQYEAFVDRIKTASDRLINAEENVANKRRRLEDARNARRAAPINTADATRLKAQEEAAQNALRRSVAQLTSARTNMQRVERNFTTTFERESNRRIKKAQEESLRLKQAIEQEAEARKIQEENQLNRVIGATTIATGALVGTVKAATTQFATFEESMRKAAAISPELQDMMGEMQSRLQDLAVQLGKSPTELAEALNEVAQAGFEGETALRITEAAARAAAAGYTDAATAARPFIGVLNAYKDAGFDAAEVSDKLFTAVTEGVFSFADLSQQLGDNLSIYEALGISLDELLASYVTLTKRSNNLSESTTQLNAIANAFLKPSEALTAALADLGLGTAQSVIQTRDFGEVLQIVEHLMSENKDAAGKLFPNIRSLRGIFGLTAGEVEEYNTQLQRLTGSSAGAGATQKILDFELQGTAFQLRQIREEARAVAITLGQDMAPEVLRIAHVIGDVAGAVVAFDSATGGIIGKTLVWTTALALLGVAGLRAKLAIIGAKDTIAFFGKQLRNVVAVTRAVITAINGLNAAILPTLGLFALAAAVSFVLWQRHKNQQKAAKELKKSYDDLDKTIEGLGKRRDITLSERKSLEDLRADIDLTINDSEKLRKEMERQRSIREAAVSAIPGASAFNAIDEVIFGDQPIGDIERFNKAIDEALSDDDIKKLNEQVTALFTQQDLDVGAVVTEITTYRKELAEGVITGDEFLQKITDMAEKSGEWTNEARRMANATVSLGNSLVNTTEFFGNADTKANDLREALAKFTEEAYTAIGALDNLGSPLEFIQGRLGNLGEGVAETVLRMEQLGELHLDPDQLIGVEAAAAVEDYKQKIDELLNEFASSNDQINEWVNLNKTVTDLVGDETNGFAGLTDMVNRHKITQEEANRIQEAAAYIQRQTTIAVDEERVSQAKALPQLAQWVQKHDLAKDAYDNLLPGQKAFAESLKDTNNQVLILTTLMFKLAIAMDPNAVNQDYFKEFIRGIAIANPEALAMLDTMGLIPNEIKIELKEEFADATDDASDLAAKVIDIKAQLHDLHTDPLILNTSEGREQIELLEKELSLVTEKQYLLSVGADTSDVDQQLADLDTGGLGNLSSSTEAVGDRWSEVFAQMEEDTVSLSNAAADTAENVLQEIGAIADLSDPIAFLNKQFGTTDLVLSDILGKIDVVKGPFKLSVDQQEALRLYNTLVKTEKQIVKMDDAISANDSEMAEWQGRIDFLDRTIGDGKDTLSDWRAELEAGTITQEEFNAAIASGEAHTAYAQLDQLLKMNLISQEEYDDALRAGIWLRDRAVDGIFEERAANAKLIPHLAALIQLHDRQESSYDNLDASQKRFIAGIQDENVQMALQTALMLAQLEAMGALAAGTTQKFVDSVSDGNSVVGAFFDDIQFKADNLKPVIKVQIVEDPEATSQGVVNDATRTVRDAAGNEIVVPVKADTSDVSTNVPDPDPVNVPITVDPAPAKTELITFATDAQTLGYSAGTNYDLALGQSIIDNAAFITTALQAGPNLALINNINGASSLGELVGRATDFGVARGLIQNVGPVNAAARFVALSLYSSMIRALLISSPSKRGEFVGAMFLRGVGDAVLSEGEIVVRQAQSVADRMVGAFDRTFKEATLPSLVAGSPSVPGRVPMTPSSGAFSGSSTTIGSTYNIDIDVNGASGDGEQIADQVWTKLHGSLRRLEKQRAPA